MVHWASTAQRRPVSAGIPTPTGQCLHGTMIQVGVLGVVGLSWGRMIILFGGNSHGVEDRRNSRPSGGQKIRVGAVARSPEGGFGDRWYRAIGCRAVSGRKPRDPKQLALETGGRSCAVVPLRWARSVDDPPGHIGYPSGHRPSGRKCGSCCGPVASASFDVA